MSAVRSTTDRDLTVLTLVVAAAVFLDAYCLGCKSLWLDEGFTLGNMYLGGFEFLKHVVGDPAMPLYYGLLRVWAVFGTGEAFVRAFSILPAAAAIPIIYVLGRRLMGRAQGLIAALLLATNSFVVSYAQEARGYTLAMMLATLSTLLFVAAVGNPSKKVWVQYVVVSALALTAHMFGVYVILAHAGSLLLLERRVRRSLPLAKVYGAITLVACLGAVPLVYLKVTGRTFGWIPPSFGDLLTAPSILAGHPWALTPYLLVAAIPIVVLSGSIRRRPSDEGWKLLLLTLWFVLPVVGSFLASQVVPMFLTRYLIVAVPALALLAAEGLTRLPRWLGAVALATILVFSVVGLRDWYTLPKDDWRSVTDYLADKADPDDPLFFVRPSHPEAYAYYARRYPETPRPEIVSSDSAALVPSITSELDGAGRFWVVGQNSKPQTPFRQVEPMLEMLDAHFHPLERVEFPGITLVLYSRTD